MSTNDSLRLQTALLSPMTERRQLVQVATNNSSTFIQFPTNSRQLILLLPNIRARANQSKTSFFSGTTDIQSGSSQTKSSKTHSSSIGSTDRSRQKFNPILSNSLLNYRKQQVKPASMQMSTDRSYTARVPLSSRPLKTKPNDLINPPVHTYDTEEIQTVHSDTEVVPDENENEEIEEIEPPFLNPSKYEYVTQWLLKVEQARNQPGPSLKLKRQKTKFAQT